MTIDDVLFYGVYLAQILVVSLYVPSRVLRKARGLIATHPPAEFPKLYPVPLATIERALRIYFGLNLALLALGLALLAADWMSGYSIDAAWRGWQEGDPFPPSRRAPLVAMAYTLLQLLPIGLFVYFESRYFKRMRVAARDRIRTAELKPRRLREFVSPLLIGAGVVTYLGATAALLFFGVPDRARALLITVLTVANATGVTFFLFWVFHGRKKDPYQTRDDRDRMMRWGWQQILVASILTSACYGIVSALIAFHLLHYVPLLGSVCAQVAAVLATGKAGMVLLSEQRHFEVYKADVDRLTA